MHRKYTFNQVEQPTRLHWFKYLKHTFSTSCVYMVTMKNNFISYINIINHDNNMHCLSFIYIVKCLFVFKVGL